MYIYTQKGKINLSNCLVNYKFIDKFENNLLTLKKY